MKKNYFLSAISVILFAFFNPSLAQTSFKKNIITKVTLSGKVTAVGTGLPLQGASIYIPDLKKGTTSDANGNYILQNIPAGNYLVQAGFVGYQNMVKRISINENTTADFALGISIIEENEIVITGSLNATTIKRNPVPIVSINKQYLQQNLSTNIIDAIARVPGLMQLPPGLMFPSLL